MEASLPDETISGFLGSLAERTSAPTGGAAAALQAAQGAALLAMAARFSGAPRHPEHAASTAVIVGDADALRAEGVRLMVADGEAFGCVAAAYQLPDTTAEERAARSAAIAAALVTATSPPADVIAVGGQLLDLAQTLAPIVSRNVAADLAAAVWAIRAAVATSGINVEANLSGITDDAARDRLTLVVAQAGSLDARAARVIDVMRATFA